MDINDKYEKLHIARMNSNLKNIDAIYQKAVQQAALIAAGQSLPAGTFSLSKIPVLNNRINEVLAQFNTQVSISVMNGITGEWNLSNQKNDIIVDRRLARTRLANSDLKVTLYDPNKKALDEFLTRKTKGLDLSERVWNNTQRFKNELEAGLGVGISEGSSASQMAIDLKAYLNEPDKLFRRIRDNEGKLQLSEAAKNYHPGQGVYRSSYKNALRLTRTEQNMAYRQSDHERWNNIPFIVGYTVKLSNNHPQYDICDVCAGNYPKGFVWNGWHPQCICYKVPIMMNDEEYNRYEDALLDGKSPRARSVNKVNDVPAGFKKWVEDNGDKISGWKSTPYWVKDNFKNGKISDGLRIKTKLERQIQTGDFTLNPETLADMKSRGIFVQNPDFAIANFNNHLKGFNLNQLFDDFQEIGEKYEINWTSQAIKGSESKSNIFQITHFGRSKYGEVNVNRIFKVVDGKAEVYHALFTVPAKLQGSGLSKEVLGAYYKQYKNAAINRIKVQANINIGGYAWARYGFSAYEEYEVRAILNNAKGMVTENKIRLSWGEAITPDQYNRIVNIVDNHYSKNPNTPFPMRLIADLGRGTENHYGKKVLLDTNWHGELNLSNKKTSRMFEDYLYGKK